MTIDSHWKGFPPELAGCSLDAAILQDKRLLNGDFLMPVALLKESAIEQNIRSMQAFAKAAGVELCPHGKTSMSPELFARQLGAGAWGMTAATAHHVRLYRQWGVRRILLANQLVAPADISLVLDLLIADDFEFFCLVDSPEGVERLAEAVRHKGLDRPLNLLLEIGASQGRTGVRSIEGSLALGRRIAHEAGVLALRGVEIFEGIYASSGRGPAAAEAMLDEMAGIARRLLHEGLFAPGEIILTGGGSALFDLCARQLAAVDLDGHATVVLRSGCYVTHDHGTYAAALEAIRARQSETFTAELRPVAALEVWAVVQSLPEPGFAVVSLGKRDVGFDTDLPRPIWHFRPDMGMPRPVGDQLRVTKLYDQHACLEGTHGLMVGDLVGFGISHPCSTFDRWRAIPVVDDHYRMVDIVTTVF
ncbi:amino acid deaminase [Sphingomonas oligophenolica]|uniref:amino acid deaminase n=1 Tax=Sphingomonas oligophenolica TaxID=301154 RepID=UPI0031D7BB97